MLTLLAQINNPAVPITQVSGDSGSAGASVLGRYIAVLMQTAFVLGGLAVLIFLFIGALNWITAGGDKGKIEAARERIIQALTGLAILSSIVAIAAFVGPVFGIDLLQPEFVNQLQGGFSDGPAGGGWTPAFGPPVRN